MCGVELEEVPAHGHLLGASTPAERGGGTCKKFPVARRKQENGWRHLSTKKLLGEKNCSREQLCEGGFSGGDKSQGQKKPFSDGFFSLSPQSRRLGKLFMKEYVHEKFEKKIKEMLENSNSVSSQDISMGLCKKCV